NPRNESAADIIDDMVKGFTSHHGSEFRRIEDRGEAIAWAIAQAREQDVVLIAGKGHETTQEVAGVRHPFSDAEVAECAWRARG
ncbi:MAG: UDP-N-acetylmuramoyl-L-alanyl-D-glutamate--2,6-diaminopimelate ligase, partial [Betaproteobacteria bacterium]|nr:UDP-N-acetylmuramoyl-L-alanyl-D-glutamate--2,6-diaminopimelate ligase [Betaproteobacteria bacterium]